MKKRISIAFLLLGACSSEQAEKEAMLPIKTMQQTVWQLMQVDEYLSRQIQTDTTIKPSLVKAQYYQRVFNLNKIDRVQFYLSLIHI